MNTLATKSICPCGHEKTIKWIQPLRFCMGFELSCTGYSECKKCGLVQSHYSGDMQGYVGFNQAIKDMEDSNNPNVIKH
jgi:hypothetical protein